MERHRAVVFIFLKMWDGAALDINSLPKALRMGTVHRGL